MKIVKVKATTLAAPFAATDTSFVVKKFVDSKDNELALASFGTEGYFVAVIKQGDTVEMVKVNGITQAAGSDDDTATLAVASSGRALDPTSPYAGSSTGEDFSTGAEVIITNDPLTMSLFARLAETNAFTGINSFAQVPSTSGGNPVSATDLTRKAYVDALVLGVLTTIDVIIPGTAGATVAAGNLVYLDTSNGRWALCDADTPATVNNVLLGIAQGAGTNGVAISGGVLLQGVDTHQTGMTGGNIMYASNTAGGISSSVGTTEVTVGVAKSATDLYFSPRFNQQITEDQQDALAGDVGTPSATNLFVTAQSLAAAIASTTLINPTGILSPYAGFSAPSGWLLCDGSAVSRATYAALYAVLNPSLGTITVTIASPGVFTLVAHGLKEGDTVFLTTTGALPTGLTANTLYYVISTGIGADVFRLSATRGGSVINTSGSQSGVHTAWRTPYGLGDGSTTFNVPSLAGKVPVGRDSTDASFAYGETGGEKTHVLLTTEMPAHTHDAVGSTGGGGIAGFANAGATPATNVTTTSAGGGVAHNNLQPYITTQFIIKT